MSAYSSDYETYTFFLFIRRLSLFLGFYYVWFEWEVDTKRLEEIENNPIKVRVFKLG